MRLARMRNVGTSTRFVYKFNYWNNDDTTVSEGIKQLRWKQGPSRYDERSTTERILSGARLAIRVPRCQRACVSLVVIVFYIYDLEMTTRADVNSAANTWGYGQIATMILSIPALTSCLKLVPGLRHKDP